MHSSLARLNSVTAFATTVILVLLGLIDFSSFPSHKPSGSVDVHSLEVVMGRSSWHMDRRVQDFVELNFDVDADFGPLFNWNTKQVFVSLVAEYNTKAHSKNQLVLWDRIIRQKKDAHVILNDAPNKYGMREVSKSFANVKDATFILKWNVMPKVGQLHYGDEFSTGSIKLPARTVVPEGAKKVRTLSY